MTKLVIFDLDGVLVDSKEVWYRAWERVFSLFNIKLSFEDFKLIPS